MRLLVIVAAYLLAATSANAAPIPINTLINGSFETGDLTGWTVTMPGNTGMLGSPPVGQVFTTGEALLGNAYGEVVGPADGEHFLAIEDSYFPLNDRTLYSQLITVEQTVALTGGATISGWAGFLNGDPFTFDQAFVNILSGSSTIATPWTAHSGGWSSGDLSSRPLVSWAPWSWVAPSDGIYTLQFAINVSDDYASFGLFDGTTVATPEPSTLAMLTCAAFGLALRRSRTIVTNLRGPTCGTFAERRQPVTKER
jgi:hypothetical protein